MNGRAEPLAVACFSRRSSFDWQKPNRAPAVVFSLLIFAFLYYLGSQPCKRESIQDGQFRTLRTVPGAALTLVIPGEPSRKYSAGLHGPVH